MSRECQTSLLSYLTFTRMTSTHFGFSRNSCTEFEETSKNRNKLSNANLKVHDHLKSSFSKYFLALRRVLAFTDGEMVRFLDRKESGHMYFCFPWFLILFRRLADHESLPTVWDGKYNDFSIFFTIF